MTGAGGSIAGLKGREEKKGPSGNQAGAHCPGPRADTLSGSDEVVRSFSLSGPNGLICKVGVIVVPASGGYEESVPGEGGPRAGKIGERDDAGGVVFCLHLMLPWGVSP